MGESSEIFAGEIGASRKEKKYPKISIIIIIIIIVRGDCTYKILSYHTAGLETSLVGYLKFRAKIDGQNGSVRTQFFKSIF